MRCLLTINFLVDRKVLTFYKRVILANECKKELIMVMYELYYF